MTYAGGTPRELGRGRSAIVYRARGRNNQPIARKVFVGETLAKLVHLVLHGAPNPYTWNRDAIEAAQCRRRLLAGLCECWFGGRVRLPALHGGDWDAHHGAFAIDMELIRGRPASLHHCFSADRDDELRDLWRNVMRPLQHRLIDAGFDGLVWQAGLGNPVAASNFLLERQSGPPPLREGLGEGEYPPASPQPRTSSADTTFTPFHPLPSPLPQGRGSQTPSPNPQHNWVWIDTESGVPALFPLNPLAMARFYLPRMHHHGHALFDDTDTVKLRAYLDEHGNELTARLGEDCYGAMLDDCERLARHQRGWRDMSRLDRSLAYALARGRIDEPQADDYRRRPELWYTRLIANGVAKGAAKVFRKLGGWLAKFSFEKLDHQLVLVTRFLFSQKYRARVGRVLVLHRIAAWSRRGQLAPAEAAYLRSHVKSDEGTVYITDFGIHLAIKPPIKFFEWAVVPALVAGGVMSPWLGAAIIASGGMIGRTAYTLGRLIQMAMRGREKPWVALGVGLLPVVGNAAYPCQIIYTSTERDHQVARFILYDLFTMVGRLIPIWGGKDTMTEHFFNRWPSVVFKRARRRLPREVEAGEAVEVSAAT